MNRRLRAIIRKEFIHIWRDPRSLAVAVIIPLVMLLLYGYGMNSDVTHLRTVVVDMDDSRRSRDILAAFSQSGYFDFNLEVDSCERLENILGSGKVSLAIVVPAGFAADLSNGGAQLQIITDGSDAVSALVAMGYAAQIGSTYSKNLVISELNRWGAGTRSMAGVNPLTRYWYNPELKSSNFIVPGLIAVILMMLSSLLTSMTVVRERERGTIEQLVVSPISPTELVIGKMVPYAAIAFVDIVLVILGGLWIFHVPLIGSPPLLLLASALFLAAALGLGMLISCAAKTQLAAMMIAVLATMLPTILLSGFMFPINGMPMFIRIITYLIPARYFLVIVRGIFLKGVGFFCLWPQMLLLLVSGVALILLSTKRFRKML